MKIKDTLNLGKTDFPMRAGLPKKEPEMQKHWSEKNLYNMRQQLNEDRPSFMLHDGPPYANGNIHVGHALNKISKDIVVRFKSMSGFRAPYVPGWDTHGLPIEQQLAKTGVKRKEMERTAYLAKCREYALSQVDKQRLDFKTLGVLGDWEHPYMTLQPEFEAAQIRVFGAMADKGYIYKGAKPIYWSPSSESALAEAEIEYHDVESPSLYIAFKARDTKGKLPEDTEFVIWTTTAWTMPSNRGVFAHPDYDYVLVAVGNRKFLVAEGLLAEASTKIGWEHPEVLQKIKGSELEYMTVQHPLYDRESLVMIGNYVTMDSGTGLVHTSPNHGEDDFNYSRKYDLPLVEDINDQGYFNENAPDFEGLFYESITDLVLEKLRAKNELLKVDYFTHSYPHDWRTKKPVLFRLVPQWFASVEKFRADILAEVDKVDFYPAWGKQRLHNMIRDRGDWVISRQRVWGVPLPIFYAEDGTAIIRHETIEHVAELFAVHGSSYWFNHTAKELLPEGFTHPGSPNGEFTKENDIMDVWFDSGSSWSGVMNTRPELSYPTDMYLEGSDQFRGWFNSSLITSVAANGVAPYKSILHQGFVLDGEGRKMSKSIGNTVAPSDVTKKYGADILRLWVASVDTGSDVRVSMDILAQIADQYKKIRNTLRFMIANTADFDPETDAVPFAELRAVDKYLLVKFSELVKQVRTAYDEYSFMSVHKAIWKFLTQDLSSFYLNFAKDVLYIEGEKSVERRGMQTVIYKLLVDIVKLLTPILPHTAEEIWSYLGHEKAEFAYLTEMPEAENYGLTTELMNDWSAFMEFRDKALKALEIARENKLIGRPMEAQLVVYPDEPTRTLFEVVDENIAQLLIVSNFKIAGAEEVTADENAVRFDGVDILVEKAEGRVCERCRRTDPTTGDDSQFPELCAHCVDIVKTNFPELTAFED